MKPLINMLIEPVGRLIDGMKKNKKVCLYIRMGFKAVILLIFLMGTYSSNAQIAFWQQYLGGAHFDKGKKVIYNPDGTLVIAGEVLSSDGLGAGNHSESSDVVVFKYATQGKYFWKVILGGTGFETLSQLIATKDEGFILIGTSDSQDGDVGVNHGSTDVWVTKLSSKGQVEWSRTFGGKSDDKGLAILETSSGNFLIGGESSSTNGNMQSKHHGGLDSWVAKLSPSGRLLWERHYGGSGNEKVVSIHEIEENSYVVVNASDSNNGDVQQHFGKKDTWIFAINDQGEMGWQANYGGTDNDDVHESIIDAEGNIVLAGTTFSGDGHIPIQRGLGDVWAFKIAPDGTLIWSNTYGGERPDGANSIFQTHDSSFVIGGLTRSRRGEGDIELNMGYYDGWLLKIDPQGARSWSRTIGFAGKDVLENVIELKEGGFLALGFSQVPPETNVPGHNGSSDMWLVNFGDPNRSGVRPFITPPILVGKIQDKDTGRPLEATITLTDNATLDSITSTVSNAEDGTFILLLPSYGLVSINVLTPGYLFFGQDILMDTIINETTLEMSVDLESIRIGSSLILKNIFFNTGKWDLLQPSYAELERVAAFMKLNPRVLIQVSGHTDNTGNRQQKVQLSLNRANSVKTYLKQHGVLENRMRVKGYGMYRPIATNKTSQGRRKNRRVEFEVINK